MTDIASRVEVARVEPEHVPALAAFYRAVWDPGATPESVRASREQAAAANPVAPGEPPPTWLVLREGRAIGHVTTIPLRLWLNGRERPAYWIKGLWVLPEYQRSAVGFLVLKAAVQEVRPALALAHDPAALRLFAALGFTDLGTLPNNLRVLRADRVLKHLDLDALGLATATTTRSIARIAIAGARVLAPLAHAGLAAWSAVASGSLGNVSVDVTAALDHDGARQLWESVRSEISAGPVRDAAAFSSRYGGQEEYLFIHVRARRALAGLGIVKRPAAVGDPRLRGIRIATLSDLLYPPSAARIGLAVLRGAEQAARSVGADALLGGVSAAALRPLMRRRAFLSVPPNLHVLARFQGEPDPVPTRLEDWWFTRGDSGGDGVF